MPRYLRSNKAVALIIVVFAMMLFAVLGWTLMNLLSGDFETNIRNLDSERALYLAESGAQEALKLISVNDPLFDADTDTLSRTITNIGQYQVTRLTVSPVITVVSAGYVPLAGAGNYRGMRQVKLSVTLGSFDKVAYAKNLYYWSQTSGSVNVAGDILALHYNGNGLPYDQDPGDYSQSPTLVPPGDSGDKRTLGTGLYPQIDMVQYQTLAGSRVWNPVSGITARITARTVLSATTLRITVTPAIFTPASPTNFNWVNGVVVRNKRGEALPLDLNTKWAYKNWGYISGRTNNSTVTLTFDTSVNMNDAAQRWAVNDMVQIGRRYTGNTSNEILWHIKGDALLDGRGGQCRFNKTDIVAEGDIVLRGTNRIDFSNKPVSYPNLASQNGHIFSPDLPSGGRSGRAFDGVIYTQNGDILFNYIQGTSLYGNNITLKGSVDLSYDNDALSLTGFITSGFQVEWQEQ